MEEKKKKKKQEERIGRGRQLGPHTHTLTHARICVSVDFSFFLFRERNGRELENVTKLDLLRLSPRASIFDEFVSGYFRRRFCCFSYWEPGQQPGHNSHHRLRPSSSFCPVQSRSSFLFLFPFWSCGKLGRQMDERRRRRSHGGVDAKSEANSFLFIFLISSPNFLIQFHRQFFILLFLLFG